MRISDWSSDVCSSDLEISRSATELLSNKRRNLLWGGNVERGAGRSIRATAADVATPCGTGHCLRPWPRRRSIRDLAFVRGGVRSEERRVGKECVSTCRSRWSRYHYTKKQYNSETQTNHVTINIKRQANMRL